MEALRGLHGKLAQRSVLFHQEAKEGIQGADDHNGQEAGPGLIPFLENSRAESDENTVLEKVLNHKSNVHNHQGNHEKIQKATIILRRSLHGQERRLLFSVQ